MASEFRPLLFNKYFPPALLLLLHLPTLAAPAIFAPFPSIWRHFSPRPVLAPVQKFNAVKSASFATPKHTRPQILFILSPKSGPRSDFLPDVVLFGLFLLSAIAYLKIAFYLCTSNPPKGVARSFKDFPLRRAPVPPWFLGTPARTRCTRKAEQTNGGHRAAPVTLRQKRPGRDRDPNNLSVARV